MKYKIEYKKENGFRDHGEFEENSAGNFFKTLPDTIRAIEALGGTILRINKEGFDQERESSILDEKNKLHGMILEKDAEIKTLKEAAEGEHVIHNMIDKKNKEITRLTKESADRQAEINRLFNVIAANTRTISAISEKLEHEEDIRKNNEKLIEEKDAEIERLRKENKRLSEVRLVENIRGEEGVKFYVLSSGTVIKRSHLNVYIRYNEDVQWFHHAQITDSSIIEDRMEEIVQNQIKKENRGE